LLLGIRYNKGEIQLPECIESLMKSRMVAAQTNHHVNSRQNQPQLV
jgi:hypothetical protein